MSLPVVATLRESMQEVVDHRRAIVRAMILPVVVATAIDFSVPAAGPHETVIHYASMLVSWALLALVAVSCHRIILIGEDSLPGEWGVYWTGRETRFFAWSFVPLLVLFGVIMAGSCLTAMPFIYLASLETVQMEQWAQVSFYLGGVLALPGFYFMGKASLILPATAIDRRPGFDATWKLARGNGWRVAVTTMTVPALLTAMGLLVMHFGPDPSPVALDAAHTLVVYLLSAFEVAALSVTYRRLVAAVLSAPDSVKSVGGGVTNAV